MIWKTSWKSSPTTGWTRRPRRQLPGALNGIIERPGDVDCFTFSAKKGQVFDVRVFARNSLRSPLDSVMSVSRANGAAVVSNDDSGGPDSYVRFTAPEDDEYRVILRDHLNDGGPVFVYRVEITPVVPALTLSLPERVQYLPVTAPVPRGNRTAFMVNVARANFGGELTIALEGAPAGLTVAPVTMAADQSTVPVLLTAEPRSAAGGCPGQSDRPHDGREFERCRPSEPTHHAGPRPEQPGRVGARHRPTGGG